MIFSKNFIFLIVDDFSRLTWVLLLELKSEAFDLLLNFFCKRVQRECNHSIVKIRRDHGGEFENKNFELFCDEHGIEHMLSISLQFCIIISHFLTDL